MTDARNRAQELARKICKKIPGSLHDIPACEMRLNRINCDRCEPIAEALAAYAKEQTDKLEDKIAEYHNAYEGAKQRNHVLEAEKLKAEMNLLGYKGAFLEESDNLANLRHSYGVLNQEKQTLEAELNAMKLKTEPLVRALEEIHSMPISSGCGDEQRIAQQALEEFRK